MLERKESDSELGPEDPPLYQMLDQIKAWILNKLQLWLEPILWKEFDPKNSGIYYTINSYDIPNIRDLKNILNILIALERSLRRHNNSHDNQGRMEAFPILEYPFDAYMFWRNYSIFMSTDSALTPYVALAKRNFWTRFLPAVSALIKEFWALCTSDNAERIADFVVEQLIALERYRQKYLKEKEDKTPKIDDRDGVFTLSAKKIDYSLRQIYKEKYATLFVPETKVGDSKVTELKTPPALDYFKESAEHNDTVRHLIKFSNGIMGIKKALDDDYLAYQRSSGVVDPIYWWGVIVKDAGRAYYALKEFDYRAIVSDNAKPCVEWIKDFLKSHQQILIDLACIADEIEIDKGLKEGTLLQIFARILRRYNQITFELKIPIDYNAQKRLFLKERIVAREKYLLRLANRINEVSELLVFKNTPLSEIPYDQIKKLQSYIRCYGAEVCIDRSKLVGYKKLLQEECERYNDDPTLGIKEIIKNRLIKVANYCGLTLHAEIMRDLQCQLDYLGMQHAYLKERLVQAKEDLDQNPHDFFKLIEVEHAGQKKRVLQRAAKFLNTKGKHILHDFSQPEEDKLGSTHTFICEALKTRCLEIEQEKTALFAYVANDSKKSVLPNEFKQNLIEARLRAQHDFEAATENYCTTGNVAALLTWMRKEDLTPDSKILQQEIEEKTKSTSERKLA